MLLESDIFIAHIKREDRLKPVAEVILTAVAEGRLQGAYTSVACLQEVVFWFYNRGLHFPLMQTVNALTRIPHLEWVSLTPEICHVASAIILEHGLSPFDSYHAATALSRDASVASSEHAFDRVRGLTRVKLEDLAGTL